MEGGPAYAHTSYVCLAIMADVEGEGGGGGQVEGQNAREVDISRSVEINTKTET